MMADVGRSIFSKLCRNFAFRRNNMHETRSAAKFVSARGEATAKGDMQKPYLDISENCIKKLAEITDAETFLRVAVEGGGCSGFQYKFDLDKKVNDDDVVFEQNGAKVVVDEASLDLIKGSTVDYHKELIRASFRIIDNPKAEQGCSCGASFNIKMPENL